MTFLVFPSTSALGEQKKQTKKDSNKLSFSYNISAKWLSSSMSFSNVRIFYIGGGTWRVVIGEGKDDKMPIK